MRTVRALLPAAARDRSLARAVVYVGAASGAYALTFAAIALVESWPLRIASAVANGVAIAMLFVAGHDACHGSLTPSPRLDRWLGRMALLPALHPYSAWRYTHTELHHGWTNLKGRDPGFAPRSLEEFRALSAARRRVVRASHTVPGLLLLYLLEVWWPLTTRAWKPGAAPPELRADFAVDGAVVPAVPVAGALVLAALTRDADAASTVGVVLLGTVVPFLAFAWMMGFATFQHHTHPRVVWYDDEREWGFFRAQVRGTVHVVFPRWAERALNNVMLHTAHHVDPRVPPYRLGAAQRTIEAEYGAAQVIVERFSVAGLRRTLRACQLYDYRAQRWLSFEGRPTTEPATARPWTR